MSVIQGLGWFLRRTRDPIALGKFYEAALGLPLLRSWQVDEHAGAMMWAGGVCVFETNVLDQTSEMLIEPGQCKPVFRTYDLAETRMQVLSAGGKLIGSEKDGRAELVVFEDVDGYPFGIEYVSDTSFFEIDRRNELAWKSGRPELPGGLAITGPVQMLSRVIQRTHRMRADLDFLTGHLGLSCLGDHYGKSMLSLGGTALLELRGDTLELERPSSRLSVRDAWILREYGHDVLLETMSKAGEVPIESMVFDGGRLDYFVTPSNRLFGFQERFGYDAAIPATQKVEDLAFRSLWDHQAL